MAESIGSFYVARSSSHKTGWRLLRNRFVDGERKPVVIKKSAYIALGFSFTMTIEQARARASQLNGENTVRRQEAVKIARIAERVERDHFHHAVFVPEELNTQFIAWLDENTTVKNLEKNHIYWSTAKRILITLQLLPEAFEPNKRQLYRYFAQQEYSYSYCEKLIWVINMYGLFVSRLSGKYFEKVPFPRNTDKEMINDAYFESESYLGASEPLTPDLLEVLRPNIKVEQYRWLFCTIWFGLRPSELDMIIEDRQQRTWRIEEQEVPILWVYQSKLTSLPRPQRWKPIPIVYEQQQIALGFLFEELQKPLTKTLKKYSGINLTLYGGRKGFTDLMLGRGQSLEDITQWLGHKSIQMTWDHYKNKQVVGYKRTS